MSELIEAVRTKFLLFRLRRGLKRLAPKLQRQVLVEETRARRRFVAAARDAGVV
jgi:hypothetical protein